MSLKKILVVDDEHSIRLLLETRLKRLGYEVILAENGQDAYDKIFLDDIWVVLTDLKMPIMDGFQLIDKIRTQNNLDFIQIIVITGHGDKDAAIQCVKRGAFDFLEKPFDLEILANRIQSAFAIAEQKRSFDRIVKAHNVKPVTSKSEKKLPGEIDQALDLISQEKFAPVLLLGESGVGKEVVAQAIHSKCAEESSQFIAVNCAAIPKDLLESELFGHEKGAFTGAKDQKVGLVELAASKNSTLFLDEIGDLDFSLQAKILRFIQERKFRRVGGTKELSFEGRLITATCKDLEQEVKEKNFRDDLYYRLSVLKFKLPSFKDREDQLQIAEFILNEESTRRGLKEVTFSPRAISQISTYPWPGNIRELKNVIERALILKKLNSKNELESLELPIHEARAVKSPIAKGPDLVVPTPEVVLEKVETGVGIINFEEYRNNLIMQAEKQAIEKAIIAAGGNKSKAAELLGIDRSTLNRIIKRYAS